MTLRAQEPNPDEILVNDDVIRVYPLTNQKILLKEQDFENIKDFANKNLPEESCGLLAGTVLDSGEISVAKVYFLENIDHAHDHFTMDPKEQFAALKDARQLGLKIIGNWHSHPESAARPSHEDKRLAFDSSLVYMIISFKEDEPILNGYRITDKTTVARHEIIIQ